jgi:hypothetical protein
MTHNLTKMTHSDYIHLLNYYKIPIPISKKQLKDTAENLIVEKLCKCYVKQAKPITITKKNIYIGKFEEHNEIN